MQCTNCVSIATREAYKDFKSEKDRERCEELLEKKLDALHQWVPTDQYGYWYCQHCGNRNYCPPYDGSAFETGSGGDLFGPPEPFDPRPD